MKLTQETCILLIPILMVTSLSLMIQMGYGQNSTNSINNNMTNSTTILSNATETVKIYLGNAQYNSFTGGLSYDPIGYESIDDATGNITKLSLQAFVNIHYIHPLKI